MSDMAIPRQAPGPAGPQAGAQAPNAITRNMSAFNPADVAMQAQSGGVTSGMTFRQWFEKSFKVSVDAPLKQVIPVLSQNVKNRNAVGKAGSIAQQAGPQAGAAAGMGQPRPMPQGAAPQPAQKPAGGVEALMGMMGGK